MSKWPRAYAWAVWHGHTKVEQGKKKYDKSLFASREKWISAVVQVNLCLARYFLASFGFHTKNFSLIYNNEWKRMQKHTLTHTLYLNNWHRTRDVALFNILFILFTSFATWQLGFGRTNIRRKKKSAYHFLWEIKSKAHSRNGFVKFDIKYLLDSNANDTTTEKSNVQQTLSNNFEADKSLIGLHETSKTTNTLQIASQRNKKPTKSCPTDVTCTGHKF